MKLAHILEGIGWDQSDYMRGDETNPRSPYYDDSNDPNLDDWELVSSVDAEEDGEPYKIDTLTGNPAALKDKLEDYTLKYDVYNDEWSKDKCQLIVYYGQKPE